MSVRVEHLTVSYRGATAPALADVSLSIAPGERLAVIGESGSGKSTFGLALAGLLPARTSVSGAIVWPDGRPPMPGRDLGVVFQDPGNSLNPVLSVGEQIAEVARRHLGLSWSESYAEAERLLARVGLPEAARLRHAFPHQLSGGQRQRVAIAEAIAARPGLLIADEPTSALDVVVQAGIVGLLRELVAEAGMTLVFITHDIALASSFADRIAVFRDGALVQAGTVADVLGAPAPYTASLIASHIDLDTPPLIGRDAA